MNFNVYQTNQKTLLVENLLIKFLFQSKDPHQPQEKPLLRQQLHTHSYAELFACLHGQICIQEASGRLYTLEEGDLAVVPSGVEHVLTAETKPHTKWAGLGLILQKSSAANATDLFEKTELLLGRQKITVYERQETLCRLIESCHQFGRQSELSTLLSFLAEFIKLPRQKNIAEAEENGTEKAKNIDRLLMLDDIINMNFAKDFSNEEIADLLFISKRQLSRLVEKAYGEPLRKIILRRRLQGAEELLKTTDQKVEEIGRMIGFTNKNSFFREFKNHYGCTPLNYRKNAKKGVDNALRGAL